MNIVYYALKMLVPKVKAFESATQNPVKYQEAVLFEYLKRNCNTLYGKEYKFDEIKTIRDYQDSVPLNDYPGLAPYIDRMKNGETDVLTVDKTVLFGVTSGTTGKQKFIPVTKYSRSKKSDVMDLWIYYISKDHPDVFNGKILAVVSPEIEGYTDSGVPYGAESGHGYKNIPEIVKSHYILPYEVFEIKDYDSKYYCILRIAMAHNITTIATMNPSTVILLCQKIENMRGAILEDIEKGTLKKELDIPGVTRRIIEKKIRPDPERANQLRKILEETNDLLPKDIWPDLCLIECWKGGPVGVYLKEFEKYFGDLPVRDFGYLASEFRGSVPVSDTGAGGVLAINSNFYEFIPKEDIDKKDRRFLLCDQLEKGKEYFIVVTTPGGLYRYNIDDIIKVTGFFNKTPVIEFVQKGLNVSSVTGEKLYESQVVEAVNNAVHKSNLSIRTFTTCVQTGKTLCYSLLVEFNEPPEHETKKEFLKFVDEELCRINCEYDSKRKSQRLCHPVLKVVRSGEFERFRKEKVKNGTHDGQFKLSELVCDLDFHKNFDIEEDVSLE